MSGDNEKKLVAAFLRFLEEKLKEGKLNEDQTESIEVAAQCLETAFDTKADAAPSSSDELSKLIQVLQVNASATNNVKKEVSEADKAKADTLKNEGNDLMKSNNFTGALSKYTEAIQLFENPTYYCNRAAAYSKLEEHQKAIDDCRVALRLDPSYAKAYGRMGLAYSCMNKHADARDCYKKALELEPVNESFKNNLDIAEQKIQQEQSGGASTAEGNPFASLGAGGGMPNLAAMLNNPQLMNMATQMMTDPNMQQFMGQMMSGMMGGGGPPPGTGATSGGSTEAPSTGGSGGSTGGTGTNPQGFTQLLEAGQRLASQMQQENPDLVEQLRRQFQDSDGNNRDGNPPPGYG